jgi:hypothetical protein
MSENFEDKKEYKWIQKDPYENIRNAVITPLEELKKELIAERNKLKSQIKNLKKQN